MNNEPQWIFDCSLSEQECIALHCQQRARLFSSWKYLLGLFLLGTAAGLGWGYRPSDVPQSLTSTEIALAPLYGLLFAGFMVLVQEAQIRQFTKKQSALSQGLTLTITDRTILIDQPGTHHEVKWGLYQSFHASDEKLTLTGKPGTEGTKLFRGKMRSPDEWDKLLEFLRLRLTESPQ